MDNGEDPFLTDFFTLVLSRQLSPGSDIKRCAAFEWGAQHINPSSDDRGSI